VGGQALRVLVGHIVDGDEDPALRLGGVGDSRSQGHMSVIVDLVVDPRR